MTLLLILSKQSLHRLPYYIAYPCFSDPFIVLTDASDKAMGVSLAKCVIITYSLLEYRQLTKAECNYSTIKREALAAVGILSIFVWLFFQTCH